SGLTKLTHLRLANNNISDTSALSGLTEIIDLDLSGNPV
ncbi:MAG: leucine-rich repeat domain-containing protein, partial [Clostridiaceae bacterium]|nr:leucine-rich repeat domain-containing protein [Clostridiaceae bacterium]